MMRMNKMMGMNKMRVNKMRVIVNKMMRMIVKDESDDKR